MTPSTTRPLIVATLALFCASSLACGDGTGNGDGGGGGAGGADAALTHALEDLFTTANSVAGYMLSDYPDTMSLNLAGNYSVDGGLDGGGDGGASNRPTLEWDGTDGNPSPGALKVTVTYTDYRQYVDVVKQIAPALDLTDRILRAQVKLVSSTPTAFPGGIQFHTSAGASYTYFGNAGLSFGPEGTWQPILLDLGVAGAPFDASMIVQLGIQVYSGDPPVGVTSLAAPITVVFEIDTITD